MQMKEKTHNYSRYRGVFQNIESEEELHRYPFEDMDQLQDALMDLQLRTDMRRHWEETIAKGGPYTLMWTLSFVRPYGDKTSVCALEAAAKFVSRQLFGPRWQGKGRGLDALVVAEPHQVSRDLRGRLHFHVLIKQQEHQPDIERLREELMACSLRLTDRFGRKMTTEDRVDVREVWDVEGVAAYLSKTMLSRRWDDIGGNLFFVHNAEVIGLVLGEKSTKELAYLH